MTDDAPSAEADVDIEQLRSRAEALEKQLAELQQQSKDRILRAELKAEAIRAGIVDLDGLKLLDISSVALNDAGEIHNPADLMIRFKKSKPWLFGNSSSYNPLATPSAQPPRQKHASEMTTAEYTAARAALLKQRF